MARITVTLVASIGLSLASVNARADNEIEALFSLDLTALTQVRVTTASLREQLLWQAPAVMSVLDGDMLRQRGYRSVAEALSLVPGFHVVDDGVGQYAVVRGIGSGQRAYGRTLKVMLDGQPLGIRSNANQFLGPELLPLTLVERIEIVRGPSSALYGADAYLGVINIITRRQQEGVDVQLDHGDTQASHSTTGATLQIAERQDAWHAIASATLADEDRSGREIPASSPRAGEFNDTSSQNDVAKPAAFYTRVGYETETQQHALMLHASERDSYGEFLDFGTLTHANRLVERQQTLSWQSAWHPVQEQRYLLRAARAWGGNSDDEQLHLGEETVFPEREFSYRTSELALESQHDFGRSFLVAGLDGNWDHESPYEVFSVDQASGERVALTAEEETRLFRNQGLYLQYQYRLFDDSDWEAAFNWRHDNHNLFGEHNSYRLGLTGSLLPTLQGKLLYGTSFKAPNAFQLYAHPLFPGDSLGNPDLDLERATTTEGQLLWQVNKELLLTTAAYYLEARDLIELQPFGFNTRWDNRGKQSGHGLENELRWRQRTHELSVMTSWHDTTIEHETALLPTLEVPTASAPRLHAVLDWRYLWPQLETGITGRYVSERRASDSNIDANLRETYSLPSYTLWRLYATQHWQAHRFTLALDNAFDEDYAEAGYGGIDLPGRRRTLWLRWAWGGEL